MSANNRQVGGTHYAVKLGGEQHWDRVVSLGLDYFQAQITKYVERCWKKNGLEDLKKARHFLDKYIEVKSPPEVFQPTHRHAEGGLYRVLGTVQLHWAPHTGMPKEWVSAVLYCNAEGEQFVRLVSDFAERMTTLDTQTCVHVWAVGDRTCALCGAPHPMINDSGTEPGPGYVNQDR